MHGEAFSEVETAAVSVSLGALGLQYILGNRVTGSSPLRAVGRLIEETRLYRLEGVPAARRTVYMVYASKPKD